MHQYNTLSNHPFFLVSGECPQEPVVSRKTGHLYEKRVLEKHIQEEGRCPVTGEQMGQGEVLSLAVSRSVRPRLTAGASVPGLLSSLQNEWDDVALEAYNLKET